MDDDVGLDVDDELGQPLGPLVVVLVVGVAVGDDEVRGHPKIQSLGIVPMAYGNPSFLAQSEYLLFDPL